MHTSEINIRVELDENKHPQSIRWSASDNQANDLEAKSVLLSFWDPKENSALRIDLWTDELMVDELEKQVYETLMTLADTYVKATGKKEGGESMKEYARKFAKESGILS